MAVKHGNQLYYIWKEMRYRCHCPKHKWFHAYGARGIRVCERWRHVFMGFEAFLVDMGPRPEGYTLERVDNEKGYEPGNCVWATKKQQARNRRVCKFITINGATRSLAEWCELRGIPYGVAASRINQYHWSPEDAVTIPVFPKGGSGATRRHMET